MPMICLVSNAIAANSLHQLNLLLSKLVQISLFDLMWYVPTEHGAERRGERKNLPPRLTSGRRARACAASSAAAQSHAALRPCHHDRASAVRRPPARVQTAVAVAPASAQPARRRRLRARVWAHGRLGRPHQVGFGKLYEPLYEACCRVCVCGGVTPSRPWCAASPVNDEGSRRRVPVVRPELGLQRMKEDRHASDRESVNNPWSRQRVARRLQAEV
eukprot:6173865-Pleurochrysis_carterae.AAC.2